MEKETERFISRIIGGIKVGTMIVVLFVLTIVMLTIGGTQGLPLDLQVSVRMLKETGQVEEFHFDRCSVYLCQSGAALISVNEKHDVIERVFQFSNGLKTLEEMGYDVRMRIPAEKLPKHIMAVWATKKPTEK